jgi:xanthine/CO dehydrogenase XdhC/CoxF family maturation factor
MKEIRSIVEAYDKLAEENKSAALVTVVQVEGSSYRRAGARMLVTEDGRMTGAISGGCLEGDALRKALLVIHQKESKIVTYDTRDEDDSYLGVQLGCAGVIQVLMEPIANNSPNNPIQLFRRIAAQRQAYVLVTLFSLAEKNTAQIGTCLLVQEDGKQWGSIPESIPETLILDAAAAAFASKKPGWIQTDLEDSNWNGFIEYIAAPVSLLIAGAGNDVLPIVHFAEQLGWPVTIMDGRPTHANPDRFQSGCTILVTKPEKALEGMVIDQRTAALLMTHNYQYDKAMLQNLLTTEIPYIGCLGPRKKLERMLDELKAAGFSYSEDQKEKLYGPVGYDIGAENADEIALAIISEIQGFMAGKKGPSLRTKSTPIHTDSSIR